MNTLPESCKAAVYHGPDRPLEMTTFPLPRLALGELLVRVTCCTLCGSDVHTFSGRRSTPLPTILGHEILGVVAALPEGDSLRDLNGKTLCVGDRITWSIAASCGECFFCTHALPQKCEQLFKYGHEAISEAHPLSGGLAEYCHLAPGTAVVRLPDEVPDEVACPVNCATATVAAAFRLGGACAGETVLIHGAGMLGLAACAMARHNAAAAVVVADVDQARLDKAGEFGATHAVLVGQDNAELKSVIEQASQGRGADLAIDLSGANAALESELEMLRIGGRCVWVGSVFPAPSIAVSAEQIVRRLITIRGLHNYGPADLRAAVAFIEQCHRQYPFASLVGQRFPFGQVEAAFDHAASSGAFRIALEFPDGP